MPKNNRRSKRRAAKRGGGSIMVPKEREGYEEGGMPREGLMAMPSVFKALVVRRA